jgi:hypothetical protein
LAVVSTVYGTAKCHKEAKHQSISLTSDEKQESMPSAMRRNNFLKKFVVSSSIVIIANFDGW